MKKKKKQNEKTERVIGKGIDWRTMPGILEPSSGHLGVSPMIRFILDPILKSKTSVESQDLRRLSMTLSFVNSKIPKLFVPMIGPTILLFIPWSILLSLLESILCPLRALPESILSVHPRIFNPPSPQVFSAQVFSAHLFSHNLSFWKFWMLSRIFRKMCPSVWYEMKIRKIQYPG